VLGVALEQVVGKRDDRRDSLVREPVVDDAVLAARLDEAAPTETGEMVRDLGLARPEEFDEPLTRT
jgi:hypothetical protein